MHITGILARLLRDQRGATAIEYGLMVGLLAVASLVALKGLANEVITTWTTVNTQANNATSQAVAGS